MQFTKAQRRRVFIKIALAGPSGSGKTFSGLLLGIHIAKNSEAGNGANKGRLAVIDTENRSSEFYSGMADGPLAGADFDVLPIDPPYSTEKYVQAILLAAKQGYSAVMVDSISHQWAGTGGIMSKLDALQAGGKGNKYTAWGKLTPEHERLKDALLQSQIHLIAAMRSKQEYALVEIDGKQVPKKMGMAPVQRDGMEYEFTVMFDLDVANQAAVSKDRTGLFKGMLEVITVEHAERLLRWVGSAEGAQLPGREIGDGQPEARPSQADFQRVFVAASRSGWKKEELQAYIRDHFGVAKGIDLTAKQIGLLERTVTTMNAALAMTEARRTAQARAGNAAPAQPPADAGDAWEPPSEEGSPPADWERTPDVDGGPPLAARGSPTNAASQPDGQPVSVSAQSQAAAQPAPQAPAQDRGPGLPPPQIQQAEFMALRAKARGAHWQPQDILDYIAKRYNADHWAKLTRAQYAELWEVVMKDPEEAFGALEAGGLFQSFDGRAGAEGAADVHAG